MPTAGPSAESPAAGAAAGARRRKAGLVALVLAAQLGGAVAAAKLFAASINTLERNGRWIATKTELERRVMGAFAFSSSWRTLAGERIDLGRWWGFQEVRTRQPLPLREVAFELRLEPGAWLAFVFDVGPERFRGIRIGTGGADEQLVFTARRDGELLSTERLRCGRIPSGRELELRVRFEPDGYSVALEGRPVGRFAAELEPTQVFGFRNGRRAVRIDDVRATLADGSEWRESFDDPDAFWLALGVLLLAAAAVDAAAWALLRRRPVSSRALARAAGLTLALALAVAGAMYARRRLARAHPVADPEVERAWLEEHAQEVRRAVRERHPTPDPEALRVLAIGTSQTWGAGAARSDDGWVEVLERRLSEGAPPGRRYRCINTGVSGLDASWLFELYREDWVELAPHVVVIDLSNNDKDAARFEAALEGFVAENERRGIATLFVLEPNSVEYTPGELPLHATMRAVAARHGIGVVDAHALLRERERAGFLWWDFVHPTSFGHRLIAEAVAPEVEALVERLELGAGRSRAETEAR